MIAIAIPPSAPISFKRCVGTLLAIACTLNSAWAQTTYLDRSVEREGVALRVRVEPIVATAALKPVVHEVVRLRVNASRLADRQPLSQLPLGAWLDRETSVLSGAVPVCGQRIAGFLGGNLLQRPLLDLTGYFVLTLDAEGSVSVLDPAVEFAGRSSLYAAVQLGGRGFDWVKTRDDSYLFVAVPKRREVLAIDLQEFAVRYRIELRGEPTRVALQPDERLLWAAYRGTEGHPDGIGVIDTYDGQLIAEVPLKSGHHEIAFSDDSYYAYVSSRDAGVVAVIETASLSAPREVMLGGQPLSLVYLAAQGHLWVIDGQEGTIHRMERDGRKIDRLALQAGIGPARLTPDGRFVLVVNPAEHKLTVLDATTGTTKQLVTVSGRPYDLQFTEQYVYVRALDSEKVALLTLASLDRDSVPRFIPAGAEPISAFPQLPVASGMTPTLHGLGAFIATPSERTVYHYMEGMNAPDSGIKTYGHTPIAVLVIQRGLREVDRGEYVATFKLPSAGKLVLALAAESTALRECIGLAVSSATSEASSAAWSIEWLNDGVETIEAGGVMDLRVRVHADRGAALAQEHLKAWLVPGGGGKPMQWPLHATGIEGEYRVSGRVDSPGGYYVHVRSARPSDENSAAIPATLLVIPASIGEAESR